MVATTPLWLQTLRHKVGGRLMELADALGLGLFAILGATLADANGMPALVSMMMGVVTAVFGGVSRDVLCNEVPKVIHSDHRPYAMCALFGCGVFLALNTTGLPLPITTLAGIAAATGLRACSPSSSTCACRRGQRTATERADEPLALQAQGWNWLLSRLSNCISLG